MHGSKKVTLARRAPWGSDVRLVQDAGPSEGFSWSMWMVIVFLSSCNEISVFQRQRSSTLLSQRQAAVPMSSHASTSQPDLRFAQTTIEDECLNSPPFGEQIGLVVIWTKLSMTDAEELRLFERFGSGQCLAYAAPSRLCFTACLSRATCSISSTCVLLLDGNRVD